MVSHQLVYVTGMLEVILAPSDSSGGSKRVAELSEASEIVKTGGGSFPRPRKSSKRAAEAFRGLGNRQNESLKLSEAPEGAVRDVGQVCRVPGKLRRRPQPPRGLGRRSNKWRKSASTSGQPHQINHRYGIHCQHHRPYGRGPNLRFHLTCLFVFE